MSEVATQWSQWSRDDSRRLATAGESSGRSPVGATTTPRSLRPLKTKQGRDRSALQERSADDDY